MVQDLRPIRDLVSVSAGDTVRVGSALLQTGTDPCLHNVPFCPVPYVSLHGDCTELTTVSSLAREDSYS